ncbi:hypothetical protein [Gaetbulibacter aestuarii]|uniref:DUF2306 domain-containing protein n=1 Tax=Gaetbulibacter aestuarii TaxID=1502358 RepID=A0ABW7MU51_9FLAO
MEKIKVKQQSKLMWYISIAALTFVILAFGSLSMVDTDRLERYLKPFVVIHILSALGWLMLFSYQSWLITKRRLEKHRSNLRLATILVVITTIFSIVITYQWGSAQRFVGESRDVLCFAILFFASIWAVNRGKQETHKRLMLMALLNLIVPATTRVKFLFDLTDGFMLLITVLIWILVPILYDLVTLRKIHKATILGIVFTILSFVLMIATVMSPLMEDIDAFLYAH